MDYFGLKNTMHIFRLYSVKPTETFREDFGLFLRDF